MLGSWGLFLCVAKHVGVVFVCDFICIFNVILASINFVQWVRELVNVETSIVTIITVIWNFARHQGIWGSQSMAPCILNLDTGWRWVVSFTLQPLLLPPSPPRRRICPFDRRLSEKSEPIWILQTSGSRTQLGKMGEESNKMRLLLLYWGVKSGDGEWYFWFNVNF